MQYTKIKPFVLFAGFMAFILAFLLLMPVSAMADDTDVPRETINIPENGEIEFELKAGQTITFYNLPAGTSYQVWEETPDGWIVQEQTDSAGKIAPVETQQCKFVNKYEPGVATATLHGSKVFNYAAAENDAFEFCLEENGQVLQTVKNTQGGAVLFNRIEYEDPGVHQYTIYENTQYLGDAVVNAGYEISDISWDTHKETVVVEVTRDNDGALHTEITYDDDGILFNNGLKKGVLEIEKEIINGTLAAIRKEFEITIALTNPNGTVSNGTYYYYVSPEEAQTKTITIKLDSENEMFYPDGAQTGLTKYVNKQTEKIPLKFKEWPEEINSQAFMNTKTGQYDLSFENIWCSDAFGAVVGADEVAVLKVMPSSGQLVDVSALDPETGEEISFLSNVQSTNIADIMSSIGETNAIDFIVTIKTQT